MNISMINSEIVSQNPVRVVAAVDEPYVTQCFDQYPLDCKNLGIDAELLHIVFTDFMHRNIDWIKVETNNAMKEYLSK